MVVTTSFPTLKKYLSNEAELKDFVIYIPAARRTEKTRIDHFRSLISEIKLKSDFCYEKEIESQQTILYRLNKPKRKEK